MKGTDWLVLLGVAAVAGYAGFTMRTEAEDFMSWLHRFVPIVPGF